VARCERTTRYQVARAFRAGAGDELAARREVRPARRLSLDEAHHRRGRELATVVSDLDRRRVVEVLDGRSRRRVERYLRSLSEPQRKAIEVVSIDPYEAYRQAIQSELPRARIVVDHFHLVRGANTALDSVRRERQRQAGRRRAKGARRSGKGASWRQDLYRVRHRLLKANERLTERERRRLIALFEREPVIAEAWGLKEAFRAIYRSQTAPMRSDASTSSSAQSTEHSCPPSPPSPMASGSGAPSPRLHPASFNVRGNEWATSRCLERAKDVGDLRSKWPFARNLTRVGAA
jgi:transposase